MNTELKEIIASDLSRIYDGKLSFKQKFFMSPELKAQLLWRKASFYRQKKPGSIQAKWYGLKHNKSIEKTHICISADTKIGKGLYIGHLGRIVIHPDAVLGNNINLSAGVTIGQAGRQEKKVPIIGNQVFIGTGAVLVGGITIGDDVLIAPNAYVNTDVPAHSVVIGNPAIIHPKENATEGYVNRTV